MNGPLVAGRLGGLTVGLVLGLAATAACWAWQRRRPGAPTPVAGLALAAASAVGIALTATTRPPGTLLPGLVVLAMAGELLRRARGPDEKAGAGSDRRLGRAAGALLAGAALVAWSLVAEEGAWIAAWVAVAVCAAGVLLEDFDRHWQGRGLTVALVAVSLAGIYATVPDVEAAVVALGVAVPMALLGLPGPLAWWRPAQPPPSLGAAGAFATAGLLVWTVAAGGSGRPGSFVGGLACFGLLAIDPLARRLPRRDRPGATPARPVDPLRRGGRWGWRVIGAQVVLVGVAARVVGRPTSVARALLLAALELAVVLAASMALDRLRGPRDRSPRDGDEIASG